MIFRANRRLPALVNRRAFTLTEVTVATAAASVLTLALGSTVYLASRATTDEDRPTAQVVRSSISLDELAAELRFAISFVERSTHAVEFTLADRTGDGVAETVRYSWSGIDGDPLTRRFNGGALQVVHDDVHEFQLGYRVQTVEELPANDEEPSSTPVEELAASFSGWSGITPTTMNYNFSANYWLSQYFELTWPAGASQFRVTRLRVKLGATSSTGQFSFGFYPAAGGVGPLPATGLIGSQQVLSTSGMPSTPDWKELAFSDVVITDADSGYNLVVKAIAAGGRMQYLRSTSAPQDATVMKMSNNSGSSWTPTIVSQERYHDAPFELYGIFEGGETEEEVEPIERHFVRGVTASLQVGDESTTRVQTTADILNAPEVAAP